MYLYIIITGQWCNEIIFSLDSVVGLLTLVYHLSVSCLLAVSQLCKINP